ncbi:MAG: protein of unknown function DUF2523 [Inoviridae sp.]|nr:MAG: protein of unknown function DUF2523 [Inoviridae sp.]
MNWVWIALSSLVPFFIRFIGASAVATITSMGVGFITFTGLHVLVDHVLEKLQSSLTGLPSVIVSFIGLTGIDTAINIVLSAAFALLVLKGVTKSGSLTNQVWRKPSIENITNPAKFHWDA